MILISCSTSSPEQYWIAQYKQCVTQQSRLQKSSKEVNEFCRQWKSPLQRANWLEKNQKDPILIVENYFKHLKQFPNSQKAKEQLARARVNYVDQWVREMDQAIVQNNPSLIWKLAKDFQHIENLLKNHAPVPEMLSQYIRNTPEISEALQTAEAEFSKEFEENKETEAKKSLEERGRFFKGFRATLVVYCRNDIVTCEERYRTIGD